MPELKAVLFEAYGGFADKRVKKLANASTFLVDDRGEGGVIGADNKPLSWFCHIYADALSDDEVRVRLSNVPSNARVEKWAEKNGATPTHGMQPSLQFAVHRGEQGLLDELAALMRGIVAPGARYDTNYFKYSCPRVANSLEKLRAVLDRAWSPGSKSTKPKPGSLF